MMMPLICAAVLAPNPDLAWMAGDWAAPVTGGEFHESWSEPMGGTVLGHGRVVGDDQTLFTEHMEIKREGEEWVMTVHLGSLTDRSQDLARFTATEMREGLVRWEREEDDFPQVVEYALQADGSMDCNLSGPGDAKTLFEFARR